MGTLENLLEEKSKILSKISVAANEGKTDLVLSESGKLERIEILIGRQRQIVLEFDRLKSDGTIFTRDQNAVKTRVSETGNALRSSRLASSRDLGIMVREAFLGKLKKEGIHLQLVRGKSIYETKSGKRVGIAVATERQPNRWFLGLPVGSFDHAILLCHRERKDPVEVLLPEEFFGKYGNSLSQSNGQIKFNVVSRGDRVLLQVPNTDGISTTGLSTDYSFLS